jgi:hypothetical protein
VVALVHPDEPADRDVVLAGGVARDVARDGGTDVTTAGVDIALADLLAVIGRVPADIRIPEHFDVMTEVAVDVREVRGKGVIRLSGVRIKDDCRAVVEEDRTLVSALDRGMDVVGQVPVVPGLVNVVVPAHSHGMGASGDACGHHGGYGAAITA